MSIRVITNDNDRNKIFEPLLEGINKMGFAKKEKNYFTITTKLNFEAKNNIELLFLLMLRDSRAKNYENLMIML